MVAVTGQLPAHPLKHRNSALYSGAEVTARTIFPKPGQASPFPKPAMGPYSLPFRSHVAPLAVLIGLAILPTSLACEQKREETAPTKPWLKDEVERESVKAAVRTRFEVTPASSLSISLPARRSRPTGRLKGISGYVDINMSDLAQTSGQIHFLLPSLEMDNLPAPEKTDVEPLRGATQLYTDATAEALRWLGLGTKVPAKLREEHASAVFEFDSLRALSHSSARQGAPRSSPSGSMRQVFATAEGELSLRGFSVSRSFATTLEFHFPTADAELPDSLVVTLRAGAVIPLSEYQIAPRAPDGTLDTGKTSLLGNLVGNQVHVTGTLSFKRRAADVEGAQTSSIPE